MIEKDTIFKWGHNEKQAFDSNKQETINAPYLSTLHFSDHFILYTFTTSTSYVVVLTKINDRKIEAPMSFFSLNFYGAELNYSEVEKQEFAVYKYIKYFRLFLLKHT